MTPSAIASKARRDRLRAEGRCPRCGQADPSWVEGQPHPSHCFACRLRVAEKQGVRWRAKVTEARITTGRFCRLCRTRPIAIIGKRRTCAVCRALSARVKRELREAQKVVDTTPATE